MITHENKPLSFEVTIYCAKIPFIFCCLNYPAECKFSKNMSSGYNLNSNN